MIPTAFTNLSIPVSNKFTVNKDPQMTRNNKEQIPPSTNNIQTINHEEEDKIEAKRVITTVNSRPSFPTAVGTADECFRSLKKMNTN